MTLLTQISPGEIDAIITLLIIIVIHFCLRMLKGTPLQFLYNIWWTFWVVFFAYLFINFAKDEVKKWWNK